MKTAEGVGDAGSPVLKQYLGAKAENPDAILLFRMGDFFETFREDAELASAVLGITLTSREFGRAGRYPMAGFPAHSAEGHIAKLLAAGHAVALCDQVEEASAAKGLVRREVTRVLTPGTVIEGSLLDPARSNHLGAICHLDGRVGIAALDVSTGRIDLYEVANTTGAVIEVLNRVAPSELLLPDEGHDFDPLAEGPLGAGEERAWQVTAHLASRGRPTSGLDAWRFEAERGRQRVKELLGVASLRGFDCDDLGPALGALGAALDYLARNHVQLPRQLVRLRRVRPDSGMFLDAATIANLELVAGLGGSGGGLLALLDRTRTPMGARTVRQWLLAPLVSAEPVNQRLAAVEELSQDIALRQGLAAQLRRVRDLERLTARAMQGHATPRDLGAIRDSLPALAELRDTLGGARGLLLAAAAERIDPEVALRDRLGLALNQDLPATAADGGSIKPGYDPELDALHAGIRDAREWIADLEKREREATGIKGLKVGFNRVFGYYIEVSNANRLPLPDGYVRKQTLTGGERYITPDLKERESVVLNGEQAIVNREKEVLAALARAVGERATTLLESAEAVARVDCLSGLAEAALEHGWRRPEVVEGFDLSLEGGRHPLVEAALGPGRFVPNDLDLDEAGRVMLLTGPNMAGKSTFLRQVGLLVLMAQMGSFIPVDRARIGIVDRVFTRVGAQDAIAAGLSTFMVEMVETAAILNDATRSSLVVFDEIGRGTSTYDGMSIAQAVVEHIHSAPGLGCKTLFATHFHELTSLAERLPGMRNHRVEVSEEGGKVTFLHRIVPGGADRSYGIHVAEIAGLPRSVVSRAREVLGTLEEARPLARGDRGPDAQMALPIEVEHPLVRELAGIDIESLSPLEALNRLAALKSLGSSR